jgi:hypothetical protein
MLPNGTISGTPSQSGSSSYTVTVTDSAGNQGAVTCTITVQPAPTASCVAMSPVVGVNLKSSPLSGGGGVGGHYTFSASGLPRGLVMSSNGSVSGTPAASGTFHYTITVTDSAGNTGTVPCSVTVLSSREAELERAKEELENAIRRYEAAPPAEHEHGFNLDFPELDFPLPPGSSLQVRFFDSGESKHFATVNVDPATGQAFFADVPGKKRDLEAIFNGVLLQRVNNAVAS